MCVSVCGIKYLTFTNNRRTHTRTHTFTAAVVCAGQIVKTKINLVVVRTLTYTRTLVHSYTHTHRRTKDSDSRHFGARPSCLGRADKYAMLVFGCRTKSHYICFILFAASTSFSCSFASAAAAAFTSILFLFHFFAIPCNFHQMQLAKLLKHICCIFILIALAFILLLKAPPSLFIFRLNKLCLIA